jgi:hypothetical protein
MRRSFLAILLGVLALGAADARASVIFSNFGPGDTYTTTGGQTTSTLVNVGVKFVPISATTPTHVTVAMKSTGGSTVTIAICSETSNRPGAVLFSTTVPIVAGTDPQVYTATFATPMQLIAGTNYWIRASGGVETWMPNSIGGVGFAFTSTTGAWNVSPNGVTPVVRLEDDVPGVGACCTGTSCAVTLPPPAACVGTNTRYAGDGTTCNAMGNDTTPCCKADFNQSGAISVQDIFDFLNAWFAGSPTADIDGGGLAVSDIFAFLNAWFAGC